MEEKALEKKETKEIEIYPLKKGRRVLLYLADAFLNFFFALFLFSVCLYPLAELTLDKLGYTESLEKAQADRDSVLYGNKLLFPKESTEPSYFNANLLYTSERYIAYLCGVEEKPEHDVLRTYFIEIRQDEGAYKNLFEKYDPKGAFFSLSGNEATLQEKYVEEWRPYFDPKDEIGSQAKKDMESFKSNFFLPSYRALLASVSTNDLTYEGVSYNGNQETFARLSAIYEATLVGVVYGSYLLSALVCFLLIPMINGNRKTLSMLALKVERINASKLTLLRKRDVLLRFVYDFVSGAPILFLIPFTAVSFNELFGLPTLFILSMVALSFVFASLIALLIDPFARPLSDRLTGSVMVDEEALDGIYRAKGYSV